MKKLNLIIGKKQIIISSLILILGAAVYLNWQFAGGDNAIAVIDVLNPSKNKETAKEEMKETTNEDDEQVSNYGEAELASNNKKSVNKKEDYFAKAKLEKQATRDDANETMQNMANSSEATPNDKANATAQLIKLTEISERETSIENQIKAMNIEDCIANLEPNKADIIVKCQDLNSAQAAKIKDIVNKTAEVIPQNIVITPIS